MCPECKSNNILFHKAWMGTYSETWCRCVSCGLKFDDSRHKVIMKKVWNLNTTGIDITGNSTTKNEIKPL